MAYVCGKCNRFDAEAERGAVCSECGGNMHFTMLDPRTTATATLDEPSLEAWHDPYANGFEVIEASQSFRYAQIGVGISAYFFISRILRVFFWISLTGAPPGRALLALAVASLVTTCFAALVGGAVAGFWARNWLLQGLGVAVGLICIPLALMLYFAPDYWPLFCVTLGATSVLAIVGAYLGHLVVKPTRVPIS